MTQVNLERHPYGSHTFYKGLYTHNSIGYSFVLIIEESESQSAIRVDFMIAHKHLPFDYGKASREILSVYNPEIK